MWRDDMRQFWLHGNLSLGQFAGRFAASADKFNPAQREPYACINMLTAHDGFTLRDLVSFNQKHNQANGEENRDGHNENFSQNHGEEGLEASEGVLQQRRLSQRALLATLCLSQGTPMLLAGDELGNSQSGNNNAYCQDNPLTWLDWENADESLTAYTCALIALRRKIPALTQNRWWQEGSDDVQWLNQQGQPMSPATGSRGRSSGCKSACHSAGWLSLMPRCTRWICTCRRETGSQWHRSTACFLMRNPGVSWRARNGGQQQKPSVSYKISLHRAGHYKNKGVRYGDIR